MATGDGQPGDPRTEAAITFQVKKEGVSADFLNSFMMVSMQCKALLKLDEEKFPLRHYGSSEANVRGKILEASQKFITYTDYMTKGGEDDKIDGFALEDFLTERGREIVARLDAIVLEINDIFKLHPEDFDINEIFIRLTELHDLVDNQGSYR
ncbi:hypothetical protein A3C60_01995 [Candidatus Nomurabacteria bacterium RIFCSPHIGHO2_02_FULL_37_45]|uniref:Uncharacterized protein n=2 Tax=Candidatus Nomuraibacteriota TaxID=1752729 RepID=A0A1F6Y2S8_9BACT|nr:MAG: hypothetical protein A2727_00770 [Candidatus Nomurabacteria bacterium RIFCSPHIGHO2_01_FULL_37_110]OGI72314.1 MAG: hypothetical protein A3C60_01995 [Candidatus Nomurabacteria bacterium RIFCSPHIGHO2_02_FULL_37_45]OGI79196.1 MAG: hypothetical protein A3F19_01870 [Candidatus Nomurabacteria bacterium RIFCSPHIGHO2_12_FULL_37_29]OGI85053.1 MAG: hypothetical protein A3A92_01270 [Candidatus Nomurabacteria bacterium RIFCSPLOWO2_01_FULL_37_49]OGJ00683.1 MAG: hypothetical protein A3G98_00440 [Candi